MQKDDLSALIKRYYKINDVIAKDDEHGLTCPNIDCINCPLYIDREPATICLYTMENMVWRTIDFLEKEYAER